VTISILHAIAISDTLQSVLPRDSFGDWATPDEFRQDFFCALRYRGKKNAAEGEWKKTATTTKQRRADQCRAAYRNGHLPDAKSFDVGFRLARVPVEGK
jgi:hypothetical protein